MTETYNSNAAEPAFRLILGQGTWLPMNPLFGYKDTAIAHFLRGIIVERVV